jgi:basic amino acid/polyamine antiporter, APA family
MTGILPRRFGLATATALVIGAIIGSGIFRVPASVAAQTGTPTLTALIWLGGGVITLCLALSLAELSTMFPRAGGTYVYIKEAYGPPAAFLYGWVFLLIGPAGWAALALIITQYFGRLFAVGPDMQRVLGVLLIAVVTLSNYYSARLSANLQTAATAAKIAAIISVVGVIFLLGSPAPDVASTQANVSANTAQVGVALVSVLFAYEGAAAFCAMSGEIRDPSRVLPRALIFGVAAVVALYLLLNAAYLYVLPFDVLANSPLVAADAMSAVLGSTGALVAALLVIVSSFGCLASLAMTDPRVFCAMAQDGLFFARVGAVHKRHATPHIAVLLFGGIAALYAAIRTFEELSATFVLGLWPFYALAVAGVLVLRHTQPESQRPYRTLGYPFVPMLFVLATFLVLIVSLVEQTGTTALNLAITAAGAPIYWLWGWYVRAKAPRK